MHTWTYLEKLIKARVEMLTTPQKNPRHPYILQPRNKMEAFKVVQPIFVDFVVRSTRMIHIFNDVSFMIIEPIKRTIVHFMYLFKRAGWSWPFLNYINP